MKRGFTLVEVMVALAVGGTVLIVAAGALGAAHTGAEEAERARRESDRAANAKLWLTRAFAALVVGQGEVDTFEGDAERVEFSSRLVGTEEWPVEQRIMLVRHVTELVVQRPEQSALRLAAGIEHIEWQYLLATGAKSEWIRGWHSPATAPLAVRLILWRVSGSMPGSDTLLFLVGERG